MAGTGVTSGGSQGITDAINVADMLTGTNTTGVTSNSGSTNTSKTDNSGSTNTGSSTTTNSGSTNETESSGSENVTKVSGSTNTTVNSGSTNTTQLMLTAKDAQTLETNILDQANGLAATTSGAHNAGMYNSSTNQLLTDDLLARTSANVAALAAPTVTTIGGSTSTTTNSGYTTDQLIGAGTVKNIIGGSTSTIDSTQTIGPSSANTTQVIGPSASTNTGNTAPKISGKTAGTLAAIGTGINAIGGVNNAVNKVSDFLSPVDTLGDVGNPLSLTGGGVGDVTGAAQQVSAVDGYYGTASTVGDIGDLGGIGDIGSAALTDSAATDGVGAIIGDSIGSAAADSIGADVVGDVVGDAVGEDIIGDVIAVAAWIVCTELKRQGKLNPKHYRYGLRHFATKYSAQDLKGYYIWAAPTTRYIRANPDSLYCSFMRWVFCNRAEYISAQAKCTGARRTVAGFVTTYGVHAVCKVLSRTVARNYSPTDECYDRAQVVMAEIHGGKNV